ncbi:nuclear transport factor 2 family protein [bacterium]|nr:nuclear transport factor 2 family protein [bacterium]
MSTPDENAEKLRQAYHQWNATKGASAQVWLDLMTDDVQMRSVSDGGGGMDFTRAQSGKSAAAAYFAGLGADWEMVHFTADEFIAQGDRVVVLSRVAFRFRATGKVASSPKADVFRFAGGKVVEFFEFFDTAAAFAATRGEE